MDPATATLTDAERLERAAWARLGLYELTAVVREISEALSIRAHLQGGGHPDLIWPLSIWIAAILDEHSLKHAREAARLGEQRLALQRVALAHVPAELRRAVERQISLYHFELEPFDLGRVAALKAELGRLDGR